MSPRYCSDVEGALRTFTLLAVTFTRSPMRTFQVVTMVLDDNADSLCSIKGRNGIRIFRKRGKPRVLIARRITTAAAAPFLKHCYRYTDVIR